MVYGCSREAPALVHGQVLRLIPYRLDGLQYVPGKVAFPELPGNGGAHGDANAVECFVATGVNGDRPGLEGCATLAGVVAGCLKAGYSSIRGEAEFTRRTDSATAYGGKCTTPIHRLPPDVGFERCAGARYDLGQVAQQGGLVYLRAFVFGYRVERQE